MEHLTFDRNPDRWDGLSKTIMNKMIGEADGTKMEKDKEGKEKPRLHFSSAGAKRGDKKEVKESQQDAENTSVASIKKAENCSKGYSKDTDKSKAGVFARVLAKVKKEETEQLSEASREKVQKYANAAKKDFDKEAHSAHGHKPNFKKAEKRSRGLRSAEKRGIHPKNEEKGYPSESNWIMSILEKNWIAGAIKHPGAEKRAAKRAGESTHEYMEKHKDDSGKSGARARLGLRLSAMAKHKK